MGCVELCKRLITLSQNSEPILARAAHNDVGAKLDSRMSWCVYCSFCSLCSLTRTHCNTLFRTRQSTICHKQQQRRQQPKKIREYKQANPSSASPSSPRIVLPTKSKNTFYSAPRPSPTSATPSSVQSTAWPPHGPRLSRMPVVDTRRYFVSITVSTLIRGTRMPWIIASRSRRLCGVWMYRLVVDIIVGRCRRRS